MLSFSSRKLKELQQENEELKNILKSIGDKEEKVNKLEEVRGKLQSELMEMNEKKAEQLNELKELKARMEETSKSFQEVKSQIGETHHPGTNRRNPFLSESDETTIIQDLSIHNLKPNPLEKVDEQLQEALTKKDKLIGENIKLEEAARELSSEIQKLKTQEEELKRQIKNLKSETDKSGFDRVYTKNEKLSLITDKIEALKTKGKNEINQIQHRINELTNEENAIQDRISLRLRELEELENSTIKDSSAYKKSSEENLLSLIVEEQNHIETIENYQRQIKELREKIAELKQTGQKSAIEIERRLEDLRSKEIEIRGNINLLQMELKEKHENGISVDDNESGLIPLLQKEQNLKDKIAQLIETENIKTARINELNDKLSAKELEFTALSKDRERQSGSFTEINFQTEKLTEELSLKQKELLAVVQTINSKTERIKTLRSEADGFEEKLSSLRNETEKLSRLNEDTEMKIKNNRLELEKIEEEKRKVAELIPALQKRRNEIVIGNKNLEERFNELFQRFNKEINQANQKRNVLEQIIIKKEKDVEEKDRILNEKLASLENTESTFTLRQIEIDSFDDIIKTISDQKELLRNDLIKLDVSSTEKRTLNKDLKMETDFLQQKFSEIEKSIHEILNTADLRLQKNSDKRITLDNEISEYESRLIDLNLKIKESMNELVELRTAVSKIKLEHEEHRVSIAKFSAIKKKLDDDIKKNQSLLNKYRQIREKIKIEQTTMTRLNESDVKGSNPDIEKLKMLTSKNDDEFYKPYS